MNESYHVFEVEKAGIGLFCIALDEYQAFLLYNFRQKRLDINRDPHSIKQLPDDSTILYYEDRLCSKKITAKCSDLICDDKSKPRWIGRNGKEKTVR